jgi:hypothetical protein
VLILVFILLITLVSLIVILWAGTFFFQGYIYTEPSAGIFWQAPAAAFVLTFGYMIWLMTIAFSSEATKTNIPVNVFYKFTPNEDMLAKPAEKIWAIKAPRKGTEGAEKEGDRVLYTLKTTGYDGQRPVRKYKDGQDNPWSSKDVNAIEIETAVDASKPDEKTKMRFDLTPSGVDDYRMYVGPSGWSIREWTKEGQPSGLPERFRFTRLLLNVFFNLAHLVGWFIVLWAILRFQWSHALGFALVMWLAVTLTVLPMMLFYAAETAEGRRLRTAQIVVESFAA